MERREGGGGVAGLIRTGSRGFHPRLIYRVKSHLSRKKRLGSLSSLNHLPRQIFIYDFVPRDRRCGRPYRRPDQSTAPKKKILIPAEHMTLRPFQRPKKKNTHSS
jgi:hypothetical protein